MSKELPKCGMRPRSRWKLFTLLASVPLLWVCAVSAASSLAEANWPQWRGPLQNGVAPMADPPVAWSETNNVKWKVKIPGSGRATPIIWGNQVFIQTGVPTGKKAEQPAAKASLPAVFGLPMAADPPPENPPPRRRPGGPGGPGGGMRGAKPTEPYQCVLLCLDRQTGKTLWQKIAREEIPHEGHHPDGSFASYSPVTDGKLVFAYFGSRGLHCYDMNGKLQWTQNFGQQRIAMGFGEGSSPALHGDTIIVNWDNEADSFIIALDKNTGKTLWKETRDERTSWSTPLVVEHDGKAQVITAATRKIRSYDLASGKLIWECGGLTPNVIPTPVAGDGMVYPISGFRGNALLAIKLGRTGDLTDTDAIAWRHNKSTPYVPSPLLYGDKLYFFAGNNGVLSCFDAKSGNALVDAERIEGLQGVYASPVGAKGKVYLAGRNGVTVVLKNSDKLEMLATNRLDEKFDASPAVAGKELFLRGHESLYCIAQD
ncbi:MAG TPA: PQQ-binding-like beta-propeller repeat protein [Candidatus Eisenbacteria bacterium]|nr:PQQ-binding-like beta-propeller repeat protein [Candidatus Eisenbacteria bacterium]